MKKPTILRAECGCKYKVRDGLLELHQHCDSHLRELIQAIPR